MSLFKELEPYVDYIHSVRKLKNYFSFDMKFSSKWVIPKNLVDGDVVPFDLSDDNYKGVSFVSLIEEAKVELVFNKISKIIKLNKDREMKEKLFKDYVDKLKKTFETTDIDKLQNLYFDFEEETLIDYEEDKPEPEVVELVGEREEEG